MQVDMHYYGTYAMARAAGLKPDTAHTIAYAAQYVDDNTGELGTDAIQCRDGGWIEVAATAHHPANIQNINRNDQRLVWVPFHFIPANQGNDLTARLMCHKNSAIAQEMVQMNLARAEADYGIELIGITAHVYADTFSHYGFSGVSSRKNKVNQDSILPDPKLEPGLADELKRHFRNFLANPNYKFMYENFRSVFLGAAEEMSGALGHGAVGTYPDRPFLRWSFRYDEYPNAPEEFFADRNNPATFLEACEALHDMFMQFAARRPDLSTGNPRDFATIRPTVQAVINTPARQAHRIEAWQNAVRDGLLFPEAEPIPTYNVEAWNRQREALPNLLDSRQAKTIPVYRFFHAANLHCYRILHELLPRHDLTLA